MTSQKTEWTPQECDPDAESIKPENISEAVWDVLDEFQKHTISQHVHPDERQNVAEVEAYLNASKARLGRTEEDAVFALLAEVVKIIPNEVLRKACSNAVFANAGIEQIIATVFGEAFGTKI